MIMIMIVIMIMIMIIIMIDIIIIMMIFIMMIFIIIMMMVIIIIIIIIILTFVLSKNDGNIIFCSFSYSSAWIIISSLSSCRAICASRDVPSSYSNHSLNISSPNNNDDDYDDGDVNAER